MIQNCPAQLNGRRMVRQPVSGIDSCDWPCAPFTGERCDRLWPAKRQWTATKSTRRWFASQKLCGGKFPYFWKLPAHQARSGRLQSPCGSPPKTDRIGVRRDRDWYRPEVSYLPFMRNVKLFFFRCPEAFVACVNPTRKTPGTASTIFTPPLSEFDADTDDCAVIHITVALRTTARR